jgi:hypothetical protein
MRKRCGTPESTDAEVIDWPSGAQAGAPWRSSVWPQSARSYRRPASRIGLSSRFAGPRMRYSVHRGRSPGRRRLALQNRSTTPYQCREQASRYSRSSPSQKHTEDNLALVVGRTPRWSSARFAQAQILRRANQRSAAARVWSSDLRLWQAAARTGRQRRVAIKARGQPVGNATLDGHAVEPRTRTI